TPGTGACDDGVDNDCDGSIDVADPSCQVAELCDGIDNDGDGEVDEDFTTLGDTCSAGAGECRADGTRVCSPDGSTTICTAMATAAKIEGPIGPTCSDAQDNDCD